MNDLTHQVAQNTKLLQSLLSQRKHTIVRTCGEEHSANGSGSATVWLTLDNDMAYISEMKFKLVFGSPNSSTTPSAPSGSGQRPQQWGENTWPNMQSFLNAYPIGSYVDTDGYYGAQCWDYANAFWTGQVNRRLETGNGQARGTWTLRAQNAGTEFSLVYDWNSIKAGDWIVWGGGTYGHIAMAASAPVGSTVACYGENQGGAPVAVGGAAVNLTTLTQANFLGAFRYKNWQ